MAIKNSSKNITFLSRILQNLKVIMCRFFGSLRAYKIVAKQENNKNCSLRSQIKLILMSKICIKK